MYWNTELYIVNDPRGSQERSCPSTKGPHSSCGIYECVGSTPTFRKTLAKLAIAVIQLSRFNCRTYPLCHYILAYLPSTRKAHIRALDQLTEYLSNLFSFTLKHEPIVLVIKLHSCVGLIY